VLPQSVIPAMSGPGPRRRRPAERVGQRGGALFSWEPFDFGLRQATSSGAEAASRVRARRCADASRRADGRRDSLSRHRRRATRGAALQADVDRRDLLSRAVPHTR
jgi:hypothetical protein